ncbi:hypothetical protein GOV05_01770 [Candidatus Woesearchaeota archaeon]|nr:hypothetical protein [Candidatus Woesearchaeota archaeon]
MQGLGHYSEEDFIPKKGDSIDFYVSRNLLLSVDWELYDELGSTLSFYYSGETFFIELLKKPRLTKKEVNNENLKGIDVLVSILQDGIIDEVKEVVNKEHDLDIDIINQYPSPSNIDYDTANKRFKFINNVSFGLYAKLFQRELDQFFLRHVMWSLFSNTAKIASQSYLGDHEILSGNGHAGLASNLREVSKVFDYMSMKTSFAARRVGNAYNSLKEMYQEIGVPIKVSDPLLVTETIQERIR